MLSTKKLLKIFLFPIVIFVLHIILVSSKAYFFYPWIDLPMHFLGGLAIATSYTFLLAEFSKIGILKTNKKISFLFVISLVALTAVLWEFTEFAADLLFKLDAQLSLEDTMLDLFLGIIGGVLGFLIKNTKQFF